MSFRLRIVRARIDRVGSIELVDVTHGRRGVMFARTIGARRSSTSVNGIFINLVHTFHKNSRMGSEYSIAPRDRQTSRFTTMTPCAWSICINTRYRSEDGMDRKRMHVHNCGGVIVHEDMSLPTPTHPGPYCLRVQIYIMAKQHLSCYENHSNVYYLSRAHG
jgi:hypothetical protein